MNRKYLCFVFRETIRNKLRKKSVFLALLRSKIIQISSTFKHQQFGDRVCGAIFMPDPKRQVCSVRPWERDMKYLTSRKFKVVCNFEGFIFKYFKTFFRPQLLARHSNAKEGNVQSFPEDIFFHDSEIIVFSF